MTINKEHAVSDAMIEAGREKITSVLRLVPQSLPIEAEIAAREIYLAMKAASHPLEQQQAVSGDARDALDYALGHIKDDVKKVDFLECWREDKAGEWPGYLRWLAVQREGAAKAKARTALQEEGVERRD